MTRTPQKALIIGGGIGGMTAALALQRTGWEVVVLEQANASASSQTYINGGLQLTPNAVKVLRALGLMEALAPYIDAPPQVELRWGKSGRRLASMPLGEDALARWGAPYWHIARADLLQVLTAVFARRAPHALRYGVRAEKYEQNDKQISVANTQADILIGADGLHSNMRAQMLGEDAPRKTGYVAWRACVPMKQLAQMEGETIPAGVCVWVGRGRHAVTYPVRRGQFANFVGVVARSVRKGEDAAESWQRGARREDALKDFRKWNPAITNLLSAAQLHLWPLYERAPLKRWTDKRAALLGDACHPMLPFAAQGAAMGIEDAWALAASLQDVNDRDDPSHDYAGALQKYATARMPRAARVQAHARANGIAFHRAALLALLPSRWTSRRILKRQDWLYGFEPV